MEKTKDLTAVPEEILENVSGGDAFRAQGFKNRYLNESKTPTEKALNAAEYLRACGCEIDYEDPKFPCPVCGSWNVGNADPGLFRYMRVVCFDCGAFRDRDGDDPWGIGE